jgi:hypothetical protein
MARSSSPDIPVATHDGMQSLLDSPRVLLGEGAHPPATSPAAITHAAITTPIETYQRMADLQSFQRDGDTQNVLRKAVTSSSLHIPFSQGPLAEFAKIGVWWFH